MLDLGTDPAAPPSPGGAAGLLLFEVAPARLRCVPARSLSPPRSAPPGFAATVRRAICRAQVQFLIRSRALTGPPTRCGCSATSSRLQRGMTCASQVLRVFQRSMKLRAGSPFQRLRSACAVSHSMALRRGTCVDPPGARGEVRLSWAFTGDPAEPAIPVPVRSDRAVGSRGPSSRTAR